MARETLREYLVRRITEDLEQAEAVREKSWRQFEFLHGRANGLDEIRVALEDTDLQTDNRILDRFVAGTLPRWVYGQSPRATRERTR